MNTTLTNEDLVLLKKPFQPREHEFVRGFAYITEAAITERIETVDPAWQWQIASITLRGDTLTAVGRLTINGVARDGVGMAAINLTQSGGEANKAEKAAATDAMKRAARLFGVGRYLLDAPGFNKSKEAYAENVTKMSKWLTDNFAKTPAKVEEKTANFQQPPRQ